MLPALPPLRPPRPLQGTNRHDIPASRASPTTPPVPHAADPQAKHNPLLAIPGGPGLPHDYLETLEGAAYDNRVFITFDPIGTGNSSAIPAALDAESTAGLLSTRGLVAQVCLSGPLSSPRSGCGCN